MSTISDKPIGVDTTGDGVNDYYDAEFLTVQDYYAGGMLQPGRNFNSSEYRFGFNGQEKVDEISGTGNHTTAEFWEYDTRLVRRWNIDPVIKPWESGYAAFKNNPIYYTDRKGLDGEGPNNECDGDLRNQTGGQDQIYNNGEWQNVNLKEVTITESKNRFDLLDKPSKGKASDVVGGVGSISKTRGIVNAGVATAEGAIATGKAIMPVASTMADLTYNHNLPVAGFLLNDKFSELENTILGASFDAGYGSFNKALDRYNSSQPSASHQIMGIYLTSTEFEGFLTNRSLNLSSLTYSTPTLGGGSVPYSDNSSKPQMFIAIKSSDIQPDGTIDFRDTNRLPINR